MAILPVQKPIRKRYTNPDSSPLDRVSQHAVAWASRDDAVARPGEAAAVPAPAESGLVLLTVPEAARRLSISPSTIYQAIQRGEFPCVKFGRYGRVPVEAMDQWVESQTKRPS